MDSRSLIQKTERRDIVGYNESGRGGMAGGGIHAEKKNRPSSPARFLPDLGGPARPAFSCAIRATEFPKSRIPYTRDRATGEAAGVAEGLKRGVARPWHSDTLCRNMGARGRCNGSSRTESSKFIRSTAVS